MTTTTAAPLPKLGDLITRRPGWTYRAAGMPTLGGTANLHVWTATAPSGATGVAAMVTDAGEGLSITNGIEYIHAALMREFGPLLVLLEHYPANRGADRAEHIDQVRVISRQAPQWRRVWPTQEDNPNHAVFEAWIAANADELRSAGVALPRTGA